MELFIFTFLWIISGAIISALYLYGMRDDKRRDHFDHIIIPTVLGLFGFLSVIIYLVFYMRVTNK